MTVGLGKIAVTTAFPYAQWLCRAVNEMAATAEEPCVTVPFADDLGPELASALTTILVNETLQREMRSAALKHGRRAQWTSVAKEWVDLLRKVAARNWASLRAQGESFPLATSATHGAGGGLSPLSQRVLPAGGLTKVWTSDLARDVIMGNRKAGESVAVLSELTMGPLRFAARVIHDHEPDCMAEVGGLGSFFTSNGIASFHGQVSGHDGFAPQIVRPGFRGKTFSREATREIGSRQQSKNSVILCAART